MKHGANIYKYAKRIGCEPNELIDFSSNINFYQPTTELTLNANTISKYADSSYKKLKEVIAKNYAIDTKQIALYNGATAAIYALLNSIKRKDVFLYTPLYGEYEKACMKKNIYKINRITDMHHQPTEDAVVIFVNPSTPEGEYHNLKELMGMWMDKNCTIILDESFLEFEALKSYKDEINNYKKLYIVQSFSKFYSCGGVRIGAIFAHKKSIKKLQTPLWNISSFDEAFLKERLKDEDFKTKSRELHKIQKQELQNILENSGLFDEIAESQSNFILTHSSRGEELYEHLLKNKILVRKCESFDYLSNDWLRFAVKDEESHKALQEGLQKF